MDTCAPRLHRQEKDGHFLVGEGVKFERIRRITGYLVGTLDRFAPAVGESPSLTDGDSGIVVRLFHYLTAVSIRSFLRRNGWSNDAKREEVKDRVKHCGCRHD